MKRKLTIIAALLLSVVSFAQKKGEMNVGGGISLDGLSSTEESSTVKSGWNKSGSTHTTPFTLKDASFGIHADFSIFVTDNLAIHSGLSYNGFRNNSAGLKMGASYYVRLCDRFYWTPGVYAGFTFGRVTSSVGVDGQEVNVKENTKVLSFKIDLATLEYRISDHFSVFTELGNLYVNTRWTDCDSHLNQIDVKRNSRSTSVGFGVSSSTYSPTLGFRYWF